MPGSSIAKLNTEVGVKVEGQQSLRELSKDLDKIGDSASKNESKSGGFFKSVATGGLEIAKAIPGIAMVGSAVGDFLGGFIGPGAEFQSVMSAVKSTSGATEEQMASLKETALALGAATDVGSVSASDAAAAIFELGKAGLSVDKINGGAAKATLQLAAAAGPEFGVANAASLAADAMNAFGKSNLTAQETANTLVGAANASSIGLGDLKFALAAAGAVANTVGLSFNDTSAAIAVLGANGLKGGDAGTSLKTMLMNLQPQTDKQIALFSKLGLVTADGANQFFTAEGKIKSMAEISGVLQTALAGQTDQQKLTTLETLFGSDAIRAGAIFANEGAEGINEMVAAMAKQGDAAKVAGEMSNNLSGKWEAMKGTVETLQIKIGDFLIPALSGVVDFANQLVGGVLAWISDPQTGATAAAIGAGIQTVGGAIMGALGGALTFVSPLLSTLMSFLSENSGPAMAALAGVILAVLVPAFIAWGTTMLTVTLPALVATMAPVLAAAAPFIALGLAIGALWMAFDNNFLGIKDIVLATWANISPIFDTLSGLLQNVLPVAFAALSAAVMSVLTPAFQMATDAFNFFVGVVQPQVANIITLVTDIGSAFLTFFSTVTSGGDILGAFGTLFGSLGTIVGDFVMATLQWLADAIPQIISKLAEWGGAFLGFIGTTVLPFIGEKLGELGSAIWEWITGGGLQALVTNLATWGGAILGFIAKDVLPFLAGKLGELGTFIWTWITGGGLQALVTNLITWGGAFLGFIAKDVLPFIAAKLGELAAAIWAWITRTAGELITNIKAFATSFWTWITDTKNGLPAKAAEIASAIWSWITTSAAQFVTNIKVFATSFWTWITDTVSGLPAKAATIASAIWSWVTTTASEFVTKIKVMATSFWTWITDTVTELPGKMAGIASTIWTWITNTASTAAAKALQIGTDVINGIIQGLKNAAGAVWDWLTGFLGGMVDQVKNFFGIQSPSSLMREEVGKPIIMGILAGLEEAFPGLTARFNELLAGITPAATTAATGAGNGVSDAVLLEAVRTVTANFPLFEAIWDTKLGEFVDRLTPKAVAAGYSVASATLAGGVNNIRETFHLFEEVWDAKLGEMVPRLTESAAAAGYTTATAMAQAAADATTEKFPLFEDVWDARLGEFVPRLTEEARAAGWEVSGALVSAAQEQIEAASLFLMSYLGSTSSAWQQAMAAMVSNTSASVADILALLAQLNNTTSNGVPLDENGLPRYQTDPSYNNPNYGTGTPYTGGGGGRPPQIPPDEQYPDGSQGSNGNGPGGDNSTSGGVGGKTYAPTIVVQALPAPIREWLEDTAVRKNINNRGIDLRRKTIG